MMIIFNFRGLSMTREEAIDKLTIVANYIGNPARTEIIEAIKTVESPWISVQDDLPSFHSDLVENAISTKNVIVLLNDGRIRETQLFCGHWKEYDKKVTHWMPIPELPKE